MKKVIVIGCPGSGKSTFARKLHEITGIPLFHLDLMYWKADRTIVEKSVFLKGLQEAMEGETWIIDGNYSSTMEMRMSACDTVFFLDHDVDICIRGIRERRGQPRPDMPWIEGEEDDEELMTFVRNYPVANKPEVMELLEKYSSKRIYVFKNQEESNRYIQNLLDEF